MRQRHWCIANNLPQSISIAIAVAACSMAATQESIVQKIDPDNRYDDVRARIGYVHAEIYGSMNDHAPGEPKHSVLNRAASEIMLLRVRAWGLSQTGLAETQYLSSLDSIWKAIPVESRVYAMMAGTHGYHFLWNPGVAVEDGSVHEEYRVWMISQLLPLVRELSDLREEYQHERPASPTRIDPVLWQRGPRTLDPLPPEQYKERLNVASTEALDNFAYNERIDTLEDAWNYVEILLSDEIASLYHNATEEEVERLVRSLSSREYSDIDILVQVRRNIQQANPSSDR